ncbi:MAG: hypothetical protein H6977_08595 [Gammaproteobacteria bacterium]|nr:hypothetical protein [Gammaproteobacteria bacterium]MCP5200059.1 hypothetical protein [Gammaproteobacteria bacterium]
MNEPLTQMIAGTPRAAEPGRAGENPCREIRGPAAHGLDTGARGWRWMLPKQGVRQMQAGERAQSTQSLRAPK